MTAHLMFFQDFPSQMLTNYWTLDWLSSLRSRVNDRRQRVNFMRFSLRDLED